MATSTQSLPGSSGAFEEATYRKVSWRLTPLLLLCYVVAYLDRVNVGFAKLQMASDLNLSDTVYGLGAGIFFFGYFLFEVPSNIILHKVGARVWIARIMASLMPCRSCGLQRNAWRSSPAAPANSESTSAPPTSTRAATYSLATRFMPSRSGVMTMTSAAQ